MSQKLPHVHGLEMDVRYILVKEVGGDLVDVIGLSEGRVAVVIVDVSGKSVGVSILMAICRTRIWHAFTNSQSFAEVLREVNRGMVEEFRRDKFVTALVCVVDGNTGDVVIVRAGHEGPLIASRPAGKSAFSCAFPSLDGMALGIGELAMFDEAMIEQTVHLDFGDLLVLYTDGVTEAVNDEGKEFSSARFADAVRALASRRASDVCDGVLETIRRFTGATRFSDDLSFVVVRRAQKVGV
ncbi:MAG TPA: PP2C family protein-serine/threonine phosphatase [Opitutaceae bacterium]